MTVTSDYIKEMTFSFVDQHILPEHLDHIVRYNEQKISRDFSSFAHG